MKKRIMATLLTTAMICIGLSGCGSSTDPNGGMSHVETGPAGYEDGPAIPADDIPPTADTVPEESDLTSEGEEQDQEEAVVDETMDEVPEAEDTGEIGGIVVLVADWKTDGAEPVFTVSTLDPESGEQRVVSTFVFEYAVPIRAEEFLLRPAIELSRYSNYADLFNEDYTAVAATKTFTGNEESHAGWMDQSGTFFDVTEALGEQSQSDFDEPRHYEAVGFTPDGCFAYADVTEGRPDATYYKVPLDNLVPGASYEADGTNAYVMTDYQTWRWLAPYTPTAWLDNSRFLACSARNSVSGVCQLFDASTRSITEFIPGESRDNWAAVIDPEKTTVAFLSAPQSGTDAPNIYLTSLDGSSSPTQLATEFAVPYTRRASNGNVMTSITIGYIYCSLLEWR